MKTPPLVTRFTRRARFRAHINTRLLRLHNGTESVTSEVSQDEALTGLSLDGEECTERAAITTRYSKHSTDLHVMSTLLSQLSGWSIAFSKVSGTRSLCDGGIPCDRWGCDRDFCISSWILSIFNQRNYNIYVFIRLKISEKGIQNKY